LRRLILDYAEVTDQGLSRLKALASMEDLSLDSTNVTDKGVPDLIALPHLRRVNLYHTFVTAKGEAELKKTLPECQMIWDKESSLPNRRRT
jgi:internalin A